MDSKKLLPMANILTEEQRHSKEVVLAMALQQRKSIDGIINRLMRELQEGTAT